MLAGAVGSGGTGAMGAPHLVHGKSGVQGSSQTIVSSEANGFNCGSRAFAHVASCKLLPIKAIRFANQIAKN
jgi:hypothetical protein